MRWELFGRKHVERYVETGGEVGHEWQPGVFTLILTTTGRRSGDPRPTPLIYGQAGDAYVVIASKGGSPTPPAWYVNLREHPDVHVQVQSDRFAATARTAPAGEKARLWPMMAAIWPAFDSTTSGAPSATSPSSCWNGFRNESQAREHRLGAPGALQPALIPKDVPRARRLTAVPALSRRRPRRGRSRTTSPIPGWRVLRSRTRAVAADGDAVGPVTCRPRAPRGRRRASPDERARRWVGRGTSRWRSARRRGCRRRRSAMLVIRVKPVA